MSKPSQDQLGHVKISVRDFKKSNAFYDLLFSQLGFTKISNKERSAGWATKEGFGIWIAQAELPEPAYCFSAPGLHHLCVKAATRDEVVIYNLIKSQTHIFDAPANYPQYTENYYAVFFADPDGIKIEVAYYS